MEEPQYVWVVGYFGEQFEIGSIWQEEWMGRFNAEALVLLEHKKEALLGPVRLDYVLPIETTEWPGLERVTADANGSPVWESAHETV